MTKNDSQITCRQSSYLLNGDSKEGLVRYFVLLPDSWLLCFHVDRALQCLQPWGLVHVKKRQQECFHPSMASQCTCFAEHMVCMLEQCVASLCIGYVRLNCFSYHDSSYAVLCYMSVLLPVLRIYYMYTFCVILWPQVLLCSVQSLRLTLRYYPFIYM